MTITVGTRYRLPTLVMYCKFVAIISESRKRKAKLFKNVSLRTGDIWVNNDIFDCELRE